MSPKQAFGALEQAVTRLRADHPTANVISAGMSGDLEDAVACGSTCVRVGTALLGSRRLASP
jgi:PLP dependent protein